MDTDEIIQGSAAAIQALLSGDIKPDEDGVLRIPETYLDDNGDPPQAVQFDTEREPGFLCVSLVPYEG